MHTRTPIKLFNLIQVQCYIDKRFICMYVYIHVRTNNIFFEDVSTYQFERCLHLHFYVNHIDNSSENLLIQSREIFCVEGVSSQFITYLVIKVFVSY